MNLTRLTQTLATAGLTSTLLIACGGGGGDATVTPPVGVDPLPAPTTVTISGVVAKGAPFAGASVIASNPTGPVGTPQTVNANGTYSITLPIGTATPIVLTASKTLPTGEVESYTSVVADKANTTANITPITNVISALLSSNGNPAQLAAQVAAGAAISQTALAAKTKAVQDVLQSASTALGVANANPLTEVFAANGTGYDKLLDSVNATITPAGASSNIEIGMKVQAASDTAQPPVSQFASNQTTPLPALPTIPVASLIADGTTAKLAQLMADTNACYALPLATRVSTAASGATTAVGVATDVSAPACKGLFTASNPANFKFDGGVVGRSSTGTGAFRGLFEGEATGQIFDTPVYDYTLPNGDVAFNFRITRMGGVPSTNTNFARLDPADQKLKFIGNQYKYNGALLPFMERREYLTLNQGQWNNFNSGYVISVNNTGEFSKVEVTSPNGRTFTLVPDAAVSFLKIANKSTTNFVILRSQFVDITKTMSVPAKLLSDNNSLAFESPEFSEAEILALPAQSAWTFKYFLVSNAGTAPDAVQVYRTRARALGMTEFRSQVFADLTNDTVSSLRSSASSDGTVALSSSVGAKFAWAVPSGALAPTSATLFGRYFTGTTTTSRASFTDSPSAFLATARSATIACSSQGAADAHCAGAVGGGFKSGSYATALNLVASDSLGRRFSSLYAIYTLTIAP